MKFDIINTDYIKNLKGFYPYFSAISLLALAFSALEYVMPHFFTSSYEMKVIFTVVISVFFVLRLLSLILYSRIGTISFHKEIVIVEKEDEVQEYNLTDINKVNIKKVQNLHYFVDFNPIFKETIELTDDDILAFKTYFSERQISVQTNSFWSWLSSLFH